MKLRQIIGVAAVLVVATTPLFAQPKLITPAATAETCELYNNMAALQGRAMLFGQHFANVMGVEFTDWKQTENRCDMKDAVGDYPAVFGFDFGRGFDKQLPAVKAAAKKGGIITFSDHVPNPHNPKSYNHIKGMENIEIASVLPGGEYHSYLLERLDKTADFASKAVINGKKIPIIYRPWHEHTGAWFWWGSKSGTAEEYCQLWRFTIEYLRDTKGVDNFIYAFSPSYSSAKDGYEVRNPGAEWFDIVGMDIYVDSKEDQTAALNKTIDVITEYARANNKIAALTEFGYRGGIQNSDDQDWFTTIFLKAITENPNGKDLVYALTWTNTNTGVWIPRKGELMHKDFKKFYNHKFTAFLKEWKRLNR